MVWSVGACVDTDSRIKFDEFFKDLIAGKNEDSPVPAIVGKIEAPIPHEGLVYDYLFEVMTASTAMIELEEEESTLNFVY